MVQACAGAVEKHVRSILSKLELHATDDDHRRVLAVLLFLDSPDPRHARRPSGLTLEDRR
jgi:hypothetical protein